MPVAITPSPASDSRGRLRKDMKSIQMLTTRNSNIVQGYPQALYSSEIRGLVLRIKNTEPTVSAAKRISTTPEKVRSCSNRPVKSRITDQKACKRMALEGVPKRGCTRAIDFGKSPSC